MIPFIGFSPDVDDTTPGVITACKNIVPTVRGFASDAGATDTKTAALPKAALSAGVMTNLANTSRLIVGTTDKLFEKSGLDWVDRSAYAYAASDSFPWRFAQFGNTTLAANKQNIIQASDSGAFADLAAAAPKTAAICSVKGFVFVGNTKEATYGDSPDRWWCSAYLNATDWVPSVATQCTTGRLVDSPGAITAVKPLGDTVVIYKDRSLYVGYYVGPPSVWQMRLVSNTIGCTSQDAVVDIGNAHVFVGFDDIYLFDGVRVTPIGNGMREWFFADLANGYRDRMRGMHDRFRALVYFFYPTAATQGPLDGGIVYNYKSGKWSLAAKAIEAPIEYVTTGGYSWETAYTWDSLPIIDKTWDDWPNVAYDSKYWENVREIPAHIGTDHKLYVYTGSPDASSITTGRYGIEDEYSLLSRVNVRYFARPATATMTNYYTEIGGSAFTTDVTVDEANGRFDVLRSAPWHKAKFDWTGKVEVFGASAQTQPDGEL